MNDSELRARAARVATTSAWLERSVDRHIESCIRAERTEARRTARSRCRARELLDAAEAALGLLGAAEAQVERDGAWDAAAVPGAEIRPMSALELGLMYVWMAADEKRPADTTRWWSGAGAGIQQRWESAAGLADHELDGAEAGPSVVAAVEHVAELVGGGDPGAISSSLLGASASAGQTGSGVLGSFVPGMLAPVAFVATKLDDDGSETWVIDSLGTRRGWMGRGLGTALARYCIGAAAKAAGVEEVGEGGQVAVAGGGDGGGDGDEAGAWFEYRIDVVPSAMSFWRRLGFEEVEASGEQEFFARRGGDRPMVKRMRRRRPNVII